MWGQFVVSVWLVKVLLVMMNWAVPWHVWVVVIDNMCWSICIVMSVHGVMVISMAPIGSVIADIGEVWSYMMRSFM